MLISNLTNELLKRKASIDLAQAEQIDMMLNSYAENSPKRRRVSLSSEDDLSTSSRQSTFSNVGRFSPPILSPYGSHQNQPLPKNSMQQHMGHFGGLQLCQEEALRALIRSSGPSLHLEGIGQPANSMHLAAMDTARHALLEQNQLSILNNKIKEALIQELMLQRSFCRSGLDLSSVSPLLLRQIRESSLLHQLDHSFAQKSQKPKRRQKLFKCGKDSTKELLTPLMQQLQDQETE